jgi:hypothetical protein
LLFPPKLFTVSGIPLVAEERFDHFARLPSLQQSLHL